MNPSVVVMSGAVRQHLLQMPLAKRHQEVQALPSDHPHQPFTAAFALGAGSGVFNIRTPIAATAWSKSVEKMLPRSWIRNRWALLRQRFTELLQGPSALVCGHIVMQDLVPSQFHDHEYVKDAEAGREHHENSQTPIAWA